jgi:hypothetical protein
MIDVNQLNLFEEYNRHVLATLWGYQSFHAIRRGIVTPKGTNYIFLFTTFNQQRGITQYRDHISGGFLYSEGETTHLNDERVFQSSHSGDRVFLFYRDKHHTPFRFFGEIFLESFTMNTDRPSKFVFRIPSLLISYSEQDINDDVEISEKITDKTTVISSRVGQGQFRAALLDLRGECAISHFKDLRFLVASHIKPWKLSNNKERLDPQNGLLLLPTYDKLFDQGYISFTNEGSILISKAISRNSYKALGLSKDLKIVVTHKNLPYLQFHREYIFIQ